MTHEYDPAMGAQGQRAMAAMLALAGLVLAAPAQAAVYVALGDSYTSAPLVLNPVGNPIDCGRSDHNYPSVVAGAIRPERFIDVSCGSATTDDLRNPQGGLPLGGTNPPQFNGLRRDADLVSIGMGGNDAGLAGTAADCLGATKPKGSPCRDAHTANGINSLFQAIRETGPKVRRAIRGIQRRSPRARIVVVGYPAAVPDDGHGCWPVVPIASGDIAWLRDSLVLLNRVLKRVALKQDADFVDTYRPTIGHDACQVPGKRWFEGAVPTAPAFPLHPNTLGEAAMARAVLAVLAHKR